MHWKSIGVLGKPNALSQNLETFKKLFHLLKQWQVNAYYENEVGALLNVENEFSLPVEKLIQQTDLILVVGGDGSMLNASHLAVQYHKPLLGINHGHLGFLTDIGPEEELSECLHAILKGEFWEEQRFLLEGQIQHQGQPKGKHIALNDIVLSLGSVSQLIEFDLWINKSFVCRQRADGLIISTPTGSTAYALSAGGPILHPNLEAIAIVPMLPHKLTSRPIVVNHQVDIKILLQSQHQNPARVSFDSQQPCDLFSGDSIHIQSHPNKLHLIHPKNYDYFQTLRDKLHWESR